MCERATQFRKVKSQTKCISLDYLIHKGIERQHYIVVVCRHRNWSTISFAYTANKAQHWRGKMHTFLEFTCCMHHEWSSRKKVHRTRSTAANRNIVMGFDWKRRRKRERERKRREGIRFKSLHTQKCKQTKRANDQEESHSNTLRFKSYQYNVQ